MPLTSPMPVLLAQSASAPAADVFGARDFLIYLAYLLTAVLFAYGLKRLSHPRTARAGNLVSSLGMLMAVVVTLATDEQNFGGRLGWATIVGGMAVGGAIGAFAARRVPMTAMPEMVALFNGSGGAASALVAMAEYWRGETLRIDVLASIGVSVLIGMITLTGSVVAWGKLAGLTVRGVRLGNPLVFPRQHALNLALAALTILGIVVVAANPGAAWASGVLVLVFALAAVLGVLLTMPIGGADMPVVISLLNSYSGLAACATGFVLDNAGLIVTGALVGASGIILTQIMCNAMDRSLLNVLAGGFGQESAQGGPLRSAEGLSVRRMDAEEAAMLLEAAQSVVIVPGYGMAVAQAQHVVAELADRLARRGAQVRFGIHPVAGRMPGHMNVLLAEANVPYERLHDLELNAEMPQTDVVLVIGANDVVNPAARDDPTSQIYGMPIFDVDRARTVMVCKRSMNPGFAGIENPLFYNENTVMLFGDAKAMITAIVHELKNH